MRLPRADRIVRPPFADIPDDPGAYLLVIELPQTCIIEIGARGPLRFEQGRYAYAGSARLGLRKRLMRLTRPLERPRWHIDWLLREPGVRLTEMRVWRQGSDMGECAIAAWLLERGAHAPHRGLGASDCAAGCPAHLLRLGD